MSSSLKRSVVLCIAASIIFSAFNNAEAVNERAAVKLNVGPHLFLDDLLIGSVSNVVRKPVTLVRQEISQQPVLTSSFHHTFQPFFTVIRDPATGLFRLWYGMPTEDLSTVRSRLAYIESNDGIHWTNTPQILDVGPVQFGASVIDEGPRFANQKERYKLGWYFEKGLKIATSLDGLSWKHLTENVVIEHNHDINGIFWDSLRQRYTALLSFSLSGETWKGTRRITKEATSNNLKNWSEPWPILTPDAKDNGETQFYAMDGFLTRGDLVIGMVKVLRDDLKADNPPQPPEAYGIGYTTVAWTRDGQDWTRERAPFLDRNSVQGSWDHAHAWIDEQVPVGDEVYLYYAGYKSGHKVNRFQERQIGLIRMRRDRYIGREASGTGILRTPSIVLSGKKLFVNADASRGEVRVQLLTPEGKPIKGFTTAECQPIQEDGVKCAVTWKKSPAALPKKVVLEFTMGDAVLFGFELQ